ncbi:MAG: hypothetical protein Q9174_003205 [Haloplaca sp. 1 TL-2023]
MKTHSLKGALLPSSGYVCFSCRLRSLHINLQSRRQQHVDTHVSKTKPELLALLDDLESKGSKEKELHPAALTEGSNAPRESRSDSSSGDISQSTLNSPGKPSVEAEKLQRQLHDKFAAQRRKDALTLQSSTVRAERGRLSEKTQIEAQLEAKKAVNHPYVAKKKAKKSQKAERIKAEKMPKAKLIANTQPTSVSAASTKAPPSPKDGLEPPEKASNDQIGVAKTSTMSRRKKAKLKKDGLLQESSSNQAVVKGKDVGKFVDEPWKSASTDTVEEVPPPPTEASKSGRQSRKGTKAGTSNVAKKVPTLIAKRVPSSMVKRILSRSDSHIKGTKATHLSKSPPSDEKAQKPMRRTRAKVDASNIQHLEADKLEITPLDLEQPPVPGLSHGLERVLFNPGVYHLQDPRSRVFNFDPYLQSIMPVNEFDFKALKEYITSSRDTALRDLASAHNKRYVGSSSSMTAMLAHFHFLLSQWRSINTSMLSREFPEKHIYKFTEIQRTPAAIFLKWRDGSYAIDADKEFANANILMSLGKSMEKLLTLKTEDFERYRKSSSDKVSPEDQTAPESYHYSTMGDFIMRSQLDAHDPRLPGTGMFDLKTRAVVSVRMDMDNYEESKGYQIKSRQGAWESYEREYFDMIRAAFLKYSLQVRMGRMDGIFVAFHNIDRIFGFQYISLAEMDSTLHSQWDTTLGDQEFKFSVSLLNEILDKATKKYPNTSLRLHFETREAQTPFMYVFAEPVTEDQITAIQTANDAKIQAIEDDLMGNKAGSRDKEAEDQGWESLQANVRDAMDEDIRDPNHEDGRLDLQPVMAKAEQENTRDSAVAEGQAPAHSSDDPSSVAMDSNGDADDDVDLEEDHEEDDDDEDREEEEEDEDEDEEEQEEEEDEEDEGTEEEEEDEDADEEDDAEDEDVEDEGDSGNTAVTKEVEAVVQNGTSNEGAATYELGSEAILGSGEDSNDAGGQEGQAAELVTSPSEGFEGAAPDELQSKESAVKGQTLSQVFKQIRAMESKNEAKQADEGNTESDEDQSMEVGPGSLSEEVASNGDEVEVKANGASENESTTDADVSFLDSIAKPREDTEDESHGKEVLAMTLTVRNKVNDNYVLRPNNLGARDRWSIEYSLDEVSSPERARSLYQACQTRRKNKLDAESRSGDNGDVDGYIRRLREISRQGARWRKSQDEKDKAGPLKVLGEVSTVEGEDSSKE